MKREDWEKIERILNFSFDAIFLLDTSCKIIRLNYEAEKSFGYVSQELEGKPIDLLFPEWSSNFKNVNFSNDNFFIETVGVRKDDDRFRLIARIKEEVFANERFLLISVSLNAKSCNTDDLLSFYESKERFSKAFYYASIGMALVAPNGSWLKVNKSVCEIVGYSESELMNLTFQDITHPDDLDLDLGYVEKMLKGKIQTYKIEKRYFHKKGHIVWVLLSVSLVKKQDGSPLYFISQIEDITQWKTTQEALLKSEERYHLLVSGTNLGIWEWNKKLKQTYFSEKYLELTGYTKDELTFGKINILNNVHPKHQKLFRKKLRISYQENIPFKIEFLFKKKSGKYRWFLAAGRAELDNNSEPFRIIGYLEDIEEKKQTEIQFESLFNSSPDGIVILNNKFEILLVNNGLEVIVDKKNSELVGNSAQLFFPNLFEKDGYFKNSFFEGDKWGDINSELYITRSNGDLLPVEVTVKAIETGKQKLFLLTIRDIRKRLSDDAERKRILTALNATSDGIFMFLPDSLKHVYVNKGASIQLGYSESELLKITPLDFKIEYSEKSYRQLLQPLISRKRSSLTIETKHKHKNGNLFDVEIIFKLATFEEKQKIIVAVVRDITERKQAQKALRLSEERYREIYENSIFGIYRTSKDGKIILANPALIRLLGFNSLEELQQRDLNKEGFAHASSREEFIRLVEAEKKLTDYESIWTTKDGKEVYIRENVKLIIDKQTGEHYYDATVEDISEKKRAEKERIARRAAEEANRTKSTFLANVSHEIRTPLNSIIGFSNLLYSSLNDSKQKARVNSIRSSGKSLLNIINDILDLSKIEAGKLNLNLEPVSLYSLVKDIELLMIPIANEKSIPFNLKIERNIDYYLLLDEVRIRQILFNLINNAIKFTEKGHVELHVNVVPKSDKKVDILLEVEDTGVGIPESEFTTIFEPFVQQNGQSEKVYGGTGLGLSITRQIVDMMRGEIRLKSKIGRGSIFSVLLPDILIVEARNDNNLSQDDINPSSLIFTEAILLVVDDNKYNRDLLIDFLSHSPIEIIEAKNGAEAVELATTYAPDLILMDLKMPVLNGLQAARIIKSNSNTAKIPIVAISASSLDMNFDDLSIFDDFILKPVVFEELSESLKKYLEHTENPAVERKKIKEETKFILNLNEQQKLKFPTVIKEIETELLPILKQAQKSQVINDIELFGETLIRFGKEKELPSLINLGKEILDLCEKFEVENLFDKLYIFQDTIRQLKKIP
ncbi:PAS domain S-box protein [Maribellus maritimus]|uniref:PAS domain S-box protein n=1 Tax=Maribellus maritimus TaxID=2870838 RepID=UPI001EEB3497|nr:PAS domain S-box protein [Maribellus maritimus]MCG6190259.1 PAS domain S-box protein [Maribellus maritimus]